MFSQRTINSCCKVVNKRYFHKAVTMRKEFEHPFWRTLRVLKDDLNFKKKFEAEEYQRLTGTPYLFPEHVDIVIIGGGSIGTSIGWWLKEKTTKEGIRVVVVEKDHTYKNCSTALSIGALRSQFTLTENIQMALYGAEFMRTLKNNFENIEDINYHPFGYLTLANEDDADFLSDTYKLQKDLGCRNILLKKNQLKERFPWLEVSDIELGCLGMEKEGWFAPMSLLKTMRTGAISKGVHYVDGEVTGFKFKEIPEMYIDGVNQGQYEGLEAVTVKLPTGETKSINFALCIIAAGQDSPHIAKLARIGTGKGLLSIGLPIEKKKRYLYSFNCKENPPGINTPMILDPAGVYLRRHGLGGTFIAGYTPLEEEDEDTDNSNMNLDKSKTESDTAELQNIESQIDYNTFEKDFRPILSHRIPAFKDVEVVKGWKGTYEYNFYDQNGVIGPHPYYNNLYIATGFSGQGIQQVPALGRAVAELILDGRFVTIDMTRLGFDRLVVDKPMFEIGPF